MTFKTKKILTGVFNKTSKKTNNEYTILNFLNDNGTTFSSMLGEGVKLPDGLKQLTEVNVEFEVQFYNGNVNGLRTIGLTVA